VPSEFKKMLNLRPRIAELGWILFLLALLYNTTLYLPSPASWKHRNVHYPKPLQNTLQLIADNAKLVLEKPSKFSNKLTPAKPLPNLEKSLTQEEKPAQPLHTPPSISGAQIKCTDHIVFTIYMCGEKESTCDSVRSTIEANSKEIWSYISDTTHNITFLDFSNYEIRRNKYNVPILRSMYQSAQKICDSAATYTYVNADLLPEPSIPESLNIVSELLKEPYMIVGRRTNVDWLRGKRLIGEEFKFSEYDTGKQFWTNAQDYFVVSRNAIDWNTIPDFVIGRVGYDNWLVDHVFHDPKVALVDGSRTMRMLHQTDKGGNQAGRFIKRPHSDTFFNYPLAHNKFDHGTTDHAQWYTQRDKDGTMTLRDRRGKVLRSRARRSAGRRLARFLFNMD